MLKGVGLTKRGRSWLDANAAKLGEFYQDGYEILSHFAEYAKKKELKGLQQKRITLFLLQ